MSIVECMAKFKTVYPCLQDKKCGNLKKKILAFSTLFLYIYQLLCNYYLLLFLIEDFFIPKIDFPHCKTYADYGASVPGYYYINRNGKINLTYCEFNYHTCHDYFLDGFRENNITYALNGYNEDPIYVNCDFNETSG